MPQTVKLAISTCRSGSTALIHAFSQHPEIECYYQPIKAGIRANGKPDYSLFDLRRTNGWLMAKETVGHRNIDECTYSLFPNRQSMIDAKPIFLLREPLETYNAWKSYRWGDLVRFKAAYRNVLDTLKRVRSTTGEAPVVTYAELTRNAEVVLHYICNYWGMPLIKEMIEWPVAYQENRRIHFPDPTHGSYDYAHKHIGQVRTFTVLPRTLRLSPEEIRQLEPLSIDYQKITGDYQRIPLAS